VAPEFIFCEGSCERLLSDLLPEERCRNRRKCRMCFNAEAAARFRERYRQATFRRAHLAYKRATYVRRPWVPLRGAMGHFAGRRRVAA
jgi:hypothetical protein